MINGTAPPSGAFTFAVVSGSARAERYLQQLCDKLSRALSPVSFQARLVPSYAALHHEVKCESAAIVWAPPLVAIDLECAGLAHISLCCSRSGQKGYFAAIFTRHVAPIETLADLAGCHFAWVDESSSAGYVVPRLHLRSKGLEPTTLFGRESFFGSHAKVAMAVLSGEVDAGATYISLDPETGRPLSAGWLEAGAALNGAYVLATAGPIPSDVVMISKSVPQELAERLVAALLDLPETHAEIVGKLFGASGFERPEPAHFDALRASRSTLSPPTR